MGTCLQIGFLLDDLIGNFSEFIPAPRLSAQLVEREEKGGPSGQTAWPDASIATRPALATATWDKSVTSSAQSWQTCHSGGKVYQVGRAVPLDPSAPCAVSPQAHLWPSLSLSFFICKMEAVLPTC